MRIPGWFFFTVAVAGHLFLLLLAHFKGTPLHLAFVPLPLTVYGLLILHRPDGGVASVISLKKKGDPSRAMRDNMAEKIDGMLRAIRRVPGFPVKETQRMIAEDIRPRYVEVSRILAEQPGLLGSRQVAIQIKLGDCMVQMERVWTAIADGHLPEADRALFNACDLTPPIVELVKGE